jgi:molecular chaperone DnaJ
MARNHYRVLGVRNEATPEEIKSAYRRRARESHPDRTGTGAESFREVQEAYELLSDPARRGAYDRTLAQAAGQSGNPAPARVRARPQPAPSPMAARTRGLRSWRSEFPQAAAPVHGAIDIALSFEEARHGGRVRVVVPVRRVCPRCGGWTRAFPCPHCRGRGVVFGEEEVIVGFPPGLSSTYEVRVPHPAIPGRDWLVVRFFVD